MRTSQQLIRLLLDDPNFHNIERLSSAGYPFERFRLSLIDRRYRGFPDYWQIAVLPAPDKTTDPERAEDLLEAARDLTREVISTQNRKQPQPLLVVSDDPEVRVARLRFDNELAFFLDSRSLPDRMPRELGTFRRSPLMAAVRSKLDDHQISSLLLVPYQPSDPAVGWRFFGRRGELDRLIHTDSNYFVIGPRKIGKTSLLSEAKRRLEERGRTVYLIPCQYLDKPQQVVEEILRRLDARTVVNAHRRNLLLDESLLPAVLRSVQRSDHQVVLILDELGNAIRKNAKDPWVFMGALREHSQTGNLRVIMSGWQEIFRKQGEFEGPFINFASLLTLRGFSDSEIEECLIDPLSLWGDIRDRRALLHRVTTEVGRQPYLLQFFGDALFAELLGGAGGEDVDTLVSRLLEEELVEIFHNAVEEVFFRSMRSPVERYLFLLRCREADREGIPLHTAELNESWVRSTLEALGHSSTFDSRRQAMEALELRGLTEPVDHHQRRHRIAAPVVYRTLEETNEPIDELIEILADEIRTEAEAAL